MYGLTNNRHRHVHTQCSLATELEVVDLDATRQGQVDKASVGLQHPPVWSQSQSTQPCCINCVRGACV